RAQGALIQLQASKDILCNYQPVKPDELGVPKDITKENRFEQSSDVLPWFWFIENGIAASWNEEFKRVSWFKARAQYERWREKLQMVKYEMFWTTLWFKHHTYRRRNGAQNAGHRAYAARQKNVWEKFRKRIEESFGTLMTIVDN
ncbi:hypothetical protein HD554DRAFT_2020623, partial [Boletus coccyginus]